MQELDCRGVSRLRLAQRRGALDEYGLRPPMLRAGQGAACGGSLGERRRFSPQNGRLAADGLHAFAEQVDVNACSRDVVMRIAVVGIPPRRRASGPRVQPRLHAVVVPLQQLAQPSVNPPRAVDPRDRRADVADPAQGAASEIPSFSHMNK